MIKQILDVFNAHLRVNPTVQYVAEVAEEKLRS